MEINRGIQLPPFDAIFDKRRFFVRASIGHGSHGLKIVASLLHVIVKRDTISKLKGFFSVLQWDCRIGFVNF